MRDLIETWASERLKTLSVWGAFTPADLPWRPEPRARSVHSHLVHQCVSEERWCTAMLGLPPAPRVLPDPEELPAFIATYAAASLAREAALAERDTDWWLTEVTFFDTRRSRLWVIMRRLLHTSHHRGQLTAYLRMLGQPLHSTYGPTADTGGLMADRAPTIYAWDNLDQAMQGAPRRPLPGPPPGKATSER